MYQNCDLMESLLLPQTGEHFDQLIEELMKRYELPEDKRSHVIAVTAAQIQKIPYNECYTTLKDLGGCILKSIAYSIALHKSRQASHKIQIDNLNALLKTNPYDQQALDALELAAKEGSEYAAEVLSAYRPVDTGDNVVSMKPISIDEIKDQGSSI
jgi:hypothetical protein